MDAVIAVVSWNTRELLRGCLHSLEPEAGAGRADVWVVDNASGDGSAQMVASDFPWVRLIASEQNLGFGGAINQVAAQTAAAPGALGMTAQTAAAAAGLSGPAAAPTAAPPWLAVANADISLKPGALAALIAAGEQDPRAGIVAPRLILRDGSTQHSLHAFPGLASTLAFNLGLGSLSPKLAQRLALEDRWEQDDARIADWAHGAFLLVRRAAFDAVGGFDPRQFLYAEDLDLAWRLARAGWHTRYEPAALVDHVRSAAISQLYGDDRDFAAQRSAYAWMLRRRGAAVMRACALVNTVGAATRAAAASPTAALRGGDAGLAAWRLRRHTRIHFDGLTASRRSLQNHR